MERSTAYHIIIVRSTGEYIAYAPAFPQIHGRAHSARAAYAQLKERITNNIRERLRDFAPIPREQVVQTKTLRLDLWYLRELEDLR